MTPVVWITGLPASGKTTLGRRLVHALFGHGVRAALVDSDEARAVITPKPTYAPEERAMVYRAIAFTAATLASQRVVPVVAATAHDASLRASIRAIVGDLLVVFAKCPLAVCEARDPKGLYRAARARAEGTFPGIHVPFVEPSDADVVIDTEHDVAPREVDRIVAHILRRRAEGADRDARHA